MRIDRNEAPRRVHIARSPAIRILIGAWVAVGLLAAPCSIANLAPGDALAAAKSKAPASQTKAAAAKATAKSGEPEKTLRGAVRAGKFSGLRWPTLTDVKADLERLYEPGGYAALWTEDRAATPAARALVRRLAAADSLGLEPADYDAEWLERMAGELSAAGGNAGDAARFELTLSVAALRYATALRRGRVDPRATGADYRDLADTEWVAAETVRELRDEARQAEVLSALEPDDDHYRALVRVLGRYRTLAKDPTFERDLDLPEAAHPGARLPAPGRLRHLLEATGDIERVSGRVRVGGGPYSKELVDGVKRFQRRHGLLPDGILWSNTIDELKRPFRSRVRQIELALERWRWLPPLEDVPPIVVNVPAFRLYAPSEVPARDGGGLAMDVLVGSAEANPTPLFADSMKYVVFRPYWELPLEIMLHEFGPRAEWDAVNLERLGFVIVDESDPKHHLPLTPENLERMGKGYRMRQLPGPNNALGLVKFMFPNPYDIYLHDTSVPGMFAFTRRDMSHGCIRVSEPVALAVHVLRDVPGWDEERVKAAMEGTEDDVRVDLPVPLPVLIVYATAEATERGEVRFYPDVYRLDRELNELLSRGYPYARGALKPRDKLAQGRISTEAPSGMTR
jgi:murein L,D-transpeptidase YcbB/YkuD